MHLLLIILTITFPACAETIDALRVHVIDGDTIRIDHRKPDIRLVGFNAPETSRPQCDAERALGSKATQRLRDLVGQGSLTFEKIACACQPGTEGSAKCNYGRGCGTLRVDDRDVGDILIAERLAVVFKCGATGCPRTPKPWCASPPE